MTIKHVREYSITVKKKKSKKFKLKQQYSTIYNINKYFLCVSFSV